jgi:hypothetical protein
MTKAVVFLAAAMVAASLGLAAQENSGAVSNPNQERNGSATRNVTVVGCLNTPASGVYSLSDERGSTYALSGNADSLRSHTLQQVEITGKQQLATDAFDASAKSTIEVMSTRVIGDHCAAGTSLQGNRDASAVASVDDAVKNGQLPQTSTILPLLGLIGLGSLVAGFFARH